MRIGRISPQAAGTTTSDVTTTSMAEEAGNASSAGNNRAYSNKGSGKDKCSNDIPSTEGRGCSKKSLCYEYRQKKELLCLWRIWAYGPAL